MPRLNRYLLSATLMLAASHVAVGQDKSYSTDDDPWYAMGAAQLEDKLAQKPRTGRAKNVILFIADGMDITLVTVSRIFEGQLAGAEGEENYLSFEKFPNTALIKTYNANAQIGGSAATASAIATGVKSNYGTVGIPASAGPNDCAALLRGHPPSIAELAAARGKATGIITTSSVTDATPSAFYAHAASRGWSLPQNLPEGAAELGCRDIALQLLESEIDVALGGGRVFFTPPGVSDPEDRASEGARADGRNLIDEWLQGRPNAAYVWNAGQLRGLDIDQTDSLLALFGRVSMDVGYDRKIGASSEPMLAELTAVAIDILSRDPDGFFLMVETEDSDNQQHAGEAQIAAHAVIELADAVTVALAKVDLEDTLIIVTGDHGHTMTFSSYQRKGNPVFGLARGFDDAGDPSDQPSLADDGKPFTSVGYRDGPGAVVGERPVLTEAETMMPRYQVQALLPKRGESHGGQDLPLYAIGPWSHLFSGVLEQHSIFHLMKHAMEAE